MINENFSAGNKEGTIRMIEQWLKQLAEGEMTPHKEIRISKLRRLKELESKSIATDEERREISGIYDELGQNPV